MASHSAPSSTLNADMCSDAAVNGQAVRKVLIKEWELRLHLLRPVWRQHAMVIARHPSEHVYFEDGAAAAYVTQAYR